MKLLIVEDLFLMRRVIRSILNNIGYSDIVEAEDGVEAIKVIGKEQVDMVLTDWLMPNMDGIQLVKAIKKEERLKDIPLLMITTMNDKDKVVKALKCGVDDFITKPFTSEILKNKIDGVLEKKSNLNFMANNDEVFYDSGAT